MDIVFAALAPIVMLLVLGFGLTKFKFVNSAFWHQADKLSYYIFFPVLLVTSVAKADLKDIDIGSTFIFILALCAVLSVIAIINYKVVSATKIQFPAIYQSLLRYNSYIYFSLILSLWGSSALALSALIGGLLIPIINMLSVSCFYIGKKTDWHNLIIQIIKNPMIVSVGIGFILNKWPIYPEFIFSTMQILSKIALPLALLSVGSAIQLRFLDKNQISILFLTSAVRLVIAPICCFAVGKAFGLPQHILNIMLIYAAVPTATSAYIFTKQLGGDHELMANLISLQTILSIFSLFVLLLFLT